MSKGLSPRKAEASATFQQLCEDVSPEAIVHAIMRGENTIRINGQSVEITDRMLAAAKDFLPFRLPRLNSIDAVNRNVDMTHEDWLRSLEDEDGTEDGE